MIPAMRDVGESLIQCGKGMTVVERCHHPGNFDSRLGMSPYKLEWISLASCVDYIKQDIIVVI